MMRKPRKKKNHRDCVIAVRLKADDYKQAVAHTEAQDLPISTWVRSLILGALRVTL